MSSPDAAHAWIHAASQIEHGTRRKLGFVERRFPTHSAAPQGRNPVTNLKPRLGLGLNGNGNGTLAIQAASYRT